MVPPSLRWLSVGKRREKPDLLKTARQRSFKFCSVWTPVYWPLRFEKRQIRCSQLHGHDGAERSKRAECSARIEQGASGAEGESAAERKRGLNGRAEWSGKSERSGASAPKLSERSERSQRAKLAQRQKTEASVADRAGQGQGSLQS